MPRHAYSAKCKPYCDARFSTNSVIPHHTLASTRLFRYPACETHKWNLNFMSSARTLFSWPALAQPVAGRTPPRQTLAIAISLCVCVWPYLSSFIHKALVYWAINNVCGWELLMVYTRMWYPLQLKAKWNQHTLNKQRAPDTLSLSCVE